MWLHLLPSTDRHPLDRPPTKKEDLDQQKEKFRQKFLDSGKRKKAHDFDNFELLLIIFSSCHSVIVALVIAVVATVVAAIATLAF